MMGKRRKRKRTSAKEVSGESGGDVNTSTDNQIKLQDESLDAMDELLFEEGIDIKYTGMGK